MPPRLQLLFLLALIQTVRAGTIQLHFQPKFGEHPLQLHSLKYQAQEELSLTRWSFLLSQFALQKDNGSWLELPEQYAYLDFGKRRTTATLSQVPVGNYQALRFSLGLPKLVNLESPTKFPAHHALNPNLNQLHWDWQQGFIFMALEGKYRRKDKSLKGFVFHLANEQNRTPLSFKAAIIQPGSLLNFSFDLKALLNSQNSISFETHGHSSHSHPNDPISHSLRSNLPNALTLTQTSSISTQPQQELLPPLFLPKTFTPFPFKTSRHFPIPPLPRDNPLLTERVELGERLFFDPILSANRKISCASCHSPEKAFSDSRPQSIGINGQLSKRHSMPLFNLAWKNSFFWDGRSHSLRNQVLHPIKDPTEMGSTLSEVTTRLHQEPSYRAGFEKAFGHGPITSQKLGLALENYLLSLTSYDSKFDQAMAGKATLSDIEQRGMKLFFTEYEPRTQQFGADCFHCHGGANFSDHQFHNNGLKQGSDLGRFQATGEERHLFQFATPSLRNIASTAPYMHDGSLSTLEEVIAHYSGPLPQSKTLSPHLAKHPKLGLMLAKEDQKALVSFLKTLTDPKWDESN